MTVFPGGTLAPKEMRLLLLWHCGNVLHPLLFALPWREIIIIAWNATGNWFRRIRICSGSWTGQGMESPVSLWIRWRIVFSFPHAAVPFLQTWKANSGIRACPYPIKNWNETKKRRSGLLGFLWRCYSRPGLWLPEGKRSCGYLRPGYQHSGSFQGNRGSS